MSSIGALSSLHFWSLLISPTVLIPLGFSPSLGGLVQLPHTDSPNQPPECPSRIRFDYAAPLRGFWGLPPTHRRLHQPEKVG